jgi:tRNA threonylcarbamoyladenosine biosynthesis protein TsaB
MQTAWKARLRLCHAEGDMDGNQTSPARLARFGMLLLGIDTCGPSGSVALGRLAGRDLEILGQIEMEGRSYSSNLVAAVDGLLSGAGVRLNDVGGIVAVNGPGSFTGVRVGLSAVKGLAERAQIPVVAVSRLEVLSRQSGVPSAALDAHRGEVFLRVERAGMAPRELLAGARELAALNPAPLRVAVCDEAAEALLEAAWAGTQLVRCKAPMAGDALRLGEARLVAGAVADLALLDGHYLRRSDAEIFGDPAVTRPRHT